MGKTKEKTVNLTEGSVAGGLWAFTLPLMLGQLLQQLYNVADAWVIGKCLFCGSQCRWQSDISGSWIF